MFWFLLILMVIFIIRPLRRFFCRFASFIVPAIVGHFVGVIVASHLMQRGYPPITMLLVPLLFTIFFGAEGHRWLKEMDY